MDRIIQRRNPLFMLVWVGSVPALLAAVVPGLGSDGSGVGLVIAATVVWIAGLQVPTISINIPMNNRVQELRVGSLSDAEAGEARIAFESRWTRWNISRTFFATVATALLLVAITAG